MPPTQKTLSFTCNDSMQSLTAVLYLLARFLFPQRPLCNIATASGSRIQPQLRRFLGLYFVPCLVMASAALGQTRRAAPADSASMAPGVSAKPRTQNPPHVLDGTVIRIGHYPRSGSLFSGACHVRAAQKYFIPDVILCAAN